MKGLKGKYKHPEPRNILLMSETEISCGQARHPYLHLHQLMLPNSSKKLLYVLQWSNWEETKT